MECLYESKRKGGRHEVKFVVARMVDGEGWEAGRAEVAREAGVREGAGTGQGAGGVGDPEPGANHIRQEDTSRCPNGPLNNTPWGVNQRTGEGARFTGARATDAAATTGRVADGGTEAGAATVAAGLEEGGLEEEGGGMVVGERGGEGEVRDGATDRGAGGRTEVARVGGMAGAGRKRGREGRGDTMEQEEVKRRKGDDSVRGGVKRKRGDG